ncbi:hypothetical protein CtesDRAFT_PD0920 [Comamonas testosteroni KF-1]|uniref:Uncharacterized protein n=1 Tax=Comamonas testosteroni (strain DSM 14576 / KF-1) TaxID=399795 RepID=B7WXF1_COMTK|nr:hypothetical protein CtesDRAFT_PD0920 [Comamonas testosteroni KF-1]
MDLRVCNARNLVIVACRNDLNIQASQRQAQLQANGT